MPIETVADEFNDGDPLSTARTVRVYDEDATGQKPETVVMTPVLPSTWKRPPLLPAVMEYVIIAFDVLSLSVAATVVTVEPVDVAIDSMAE
jgi:hypothetical protein